MCSALHHSCRAEGDSFALAVEIETSGHGWWGEEDSNLRRHEPTDLQSAPFGRLGISPEPVWIRCQVINTIEELVDAGAGGGNRTPDRLITNQLLYLLSYASRQTIIIYEI